MSMFKAVSKEEMQSIRIGSVVECADWSTYIVSIVRFNGNSVDITGVHTKNDSLILSHRYTYTGKVIGRQCGKVIVQVTP